MEEITKRDQAYIKGEIKLISIEDDFWVYGLHFSLYKFLV
jgi:hypothetical protein